MIEKFDSHVVYLKFPDEPTRKAFWVTFTDALWSPKIRKGENAKQFDKYWGPIIRGEGDWGGLESCVGRNVFNDYALKTAANLYEQNILLEVIKTEKGPGYKHETVVTPKFYIHTETRATI